MPGKTYNRRRFSSSADAPKRDVYQEVTDIIIAALEKGAESLGKWRAPWHNATAGDIGGGALPVNQDGRPYSGTNVPLLWCTAINKGYTSNAWRHRRRGFAGYGFAGYGFRGRDFMGRAVKMDEPSRTKRWLTIRKSVD